MTGARRAQNFERLILVRFGEIALKGGNRPAFEKRLAARIRQAVAPLGARVAAAYGRFLVRGGGDPAEALRRLARVFGIVSMSPALVAPLDLESIREAALLALREALAAGPGGRAVRPASPGIIHPASPGIVHPASPGAGPAATFKVESRRANKGFPLDSMALNQALGAHLLEHQPGLRVDVHRPDVTVHVEVRDEAAYVYTAVLPGPGGLPAGSGGRAALLLSGGIDSPVAAWMAMKRGLELEAVHFHSPPFTGARAVDKVIDLCRELAGWGGLTALHLVRFTEVQKAVYRHCPADLGVTVMRRMMFRIAEGIARDRGALALVTGESLGQVASQTLESLHTIGRVVRLPVLRPLIGLDKTEIVERARAIGTYDISIRPYEDCCTIFVPKHPRTRPRPEEADEAEAALDVPGLLAAAREQTEVLRIAGTR